MKPDAPNCEDGPPKQPGAQSLGTGAGLGAALLVGQHIELVGGEWGIVTAVDAHGYKYDVYRAKRVGHGWHPHRNAHIEGDQL